MSEYQRRHEWLRYELLNELARVEYDYRCQQIEWDEKAADRREAFWQEAS